MNTTLKMLHRPIEEVDEKLAADIAHLKKCLNAEGYDASDADIEWAWDQHSDDWAASWLVMGIHGPEGDVKHLLEYLKPAPAAEEDPRQITMPI